MDLEESSKTEEQKIKFSFPMLTIKTQIFNRMFNKLGTFRASKIASWIALVLVPIIAAIGLYMVFFSLITIISTPAAGEITRELGPTAYLLIPGINPILPIFYGWIAIICAIVIHEGAHGIAARSLGFRVKSSGLLFFLFIPIGAFVDVDEKQIEKSKPKRAIRVMAAGVGGNIVIAVACLIGILVIVGGLTPKIDGVFIGGVEEGMPAEIAGILSEDVFISINSTAINNYEDLRTILDKTAPGEIIEVTVARGKLWDETFSVSINLIEYEDRAIMGVNNLIDLRTKERLSFYQDIKLQTISIHLVPPALASLIVPYSEVLSPFYTHAMGEQWSVIANMLFWLWFINVNLAVFNALPIYPLDGGRIFNIALKGVLGQRLKKKLISQITSAVTLTIVFAILLMAIFPFIT